MIIRADRIIGIKFWAQWVGQPKRVRHSIHRFHGECDVTHFLLFENIRTGQIHMKNKDCLFKHGFIPFCYNLEEIDNYMQSKRST